MTEPTEIQNVYTTLQARFASAIGTAYFDKGGEMVIPMEKKSLLDILTFLKKEQGFNALSDIIGMDLQTEPRFMVIYVLTRIPAATRIRLQVPVAMNETLPSAMAIYPSANYAEREIFDMFGISFKGHPHLKRIYMEDTCTFYPLRKDFPLAGV